MISVVLHITGLPSEASAKRKSLPFAKTDGASITLASQLGGGMPLNDHLVWLWGAVHNERRYLKSLQSEGGNIAVHVHGARMPIEIRPNGAEMLHLLGAALIVNEC